MGDKSHVELYSMLLAFLEERGRPLIEFGSAERGLQYADALTFIELLRVNAVSLLGVELWRVVGDRLEIDITEIWYSNTSDAASAYKDVDQYFNRVKKASGDVFAIQFS